MLLSERNELPETSTVITILPGTLDTPANREAMGEANIHTWAPPEKVAYLIRRWADGENRPTNGSYAKLIYENDSLYTKFV
jgi:dihydropteridine reductase